MKALEILKNKINIFPEDAQSKRIKPFAKAFGVALSEMDNQVRSFTSFKEDQTNGELANKIIVAKSLASFFATNKILRVDLVAESYKTQEKTKIAEFYSAKNALLASLRTILKESQKEAVVCNYDLFNDSFEKCENGHEIIILNGRNTNVIEELIRNFDEYIIVNGNYDNLDAQDVDYNTEVLDRNVELCNRKNNEIYGAKVGKQSKLQSVISKLQEVGKHVVAFYTYKDTLIEIGCNPKNVKVYENELSKAYIPLKKLLQKELQIDLEDICEVVVNEEDYADEVEVNSPNTWEQSETSLSEGIVYNEHQVQDLLAETEESEKQVVDLQNDYTTEISSSPSARDLFESTTSNPFESSVNDNPFETNTSDNSHFKPNYNVEGPNPFEQSATSSVEEINSYNETYSNPFENSQNVNPFEETSSNEESAYSANPFEQSNPFEQTSNPFEDSPTNINPFESNTPNTNPFETSTNPFESTTNDNAFEDVKQNPFSTTNMFED